MHFLLQCNNTFPTFPTKVWRISCVWTFCPPLIKFVHQGTIAFPLHFKIKIFQNVMFIKLVKIRVLSNQTLALFSEKVINNVYLKSQKFTFSVAARNYAEDWTSVFLKLWIIWTSSLFFKKRKPPFPLLSAGGLYTYLSLYISKR